MSILLLCLLAMTPAAFAQSSHPPMTVGTPTVDSNGVNYYPVKSVYQGSQQQIIRVLQPTNPPPGMPQRILYVMPVDTGVDTLSSYYSDGFEQLRLLGVTNTYNITLIAPSFGYTPWYSDNIPDGKQMESFVVQDLVPFGDTFITGSVPQRYLVGFSKSGNGGLYLILKHPGVFNAAAIWDSPTQLTSITTFPDLIVNFGTQANFNTDNIPNLVTTNASAFQQQTRLWISGDQADYTTEMIDLHNELTAANIPHLWVTGATRAHSWSSGWLPNAVTGLDTMFSLNAPATGTIPPPRSGGQPAGVLQSSTTQVTLSLNTDVNATCQYATSAGLAYGSMPNTFTTTGGTVHSSVVTGLMSGNTYNYYVRCQDAAGHTNIDDYVVSFEVSSTAITATSTFPGTTSVISDNGLWDAPGSWAPMSENNGAYSSGTNGAARVMNPLFSPNQYAEITYSQDPGTSGWPGVMTRMQGTTNGSGYLAFATNGQIWLYRVDDTGTLSWHALASANVTLATAPRDLRLESAGNTHRVIFNGVVLFTYTDPNNVYPTGQPGIAAATYSSIVTFDGGSLSVAPVLSGGQPTGVLPAATTQTTMSATTDVNATCRYSTTSGVAFGSMPNTFSTTGGTAQSTLITGLSTGNNYSYYVRCQDAAGNTDTDDYVIAFGVSGTGTTVSSTFSGVASSLAGGMWTTPGSWGAMGENNGATASGTDAAMIINPLLGPDEYSEVTYDHDPGSTGWVGVMTRMQSATNGSGYLAFAYNEQVYLYRVDDTGTLQWNGLASANVNTGTAPRDLRLESQGSTHRVIFNGVVVITYTDPNNVYSSGQPGIAAATFSTILTFDAGTIPIVAVLSGGQPTGVLPASTTQATLSLVTNLNATCSYATTPGVAYSAMTNTFTTTGTTAQSTLLTGLVSGTNYTYYVRCLDSAGNPNTSDYLISFAVSSTATTASSTFSGVASVLSDNGLWQKPGSWGTMSENNGVTASGTDAAMVANPLLNPNQYSEITYSQDPGTTGWVGVMTRIQSATNGSGYLAFAYNEEVYLYRVDDTGSLAWNALASASANTGASPRDLRLESQGSTHRVLFNGVLLITYTDANNVYTTGQPGIAAATFGTIQTFNGGALAIAPVLSGGQPSGVLAATTTQATLSLTTNESATCRYSTTAGVAYSAMTNTFSTTGSSAQSTVVTGLVSGTSYTYYVRCQDSAGNVNTSDYLISFSVSSNATTVSSTFPGVASVLSDNGLWQKPGSWGTMTENNGANASGTDAAMVANPFLGPDEYSEITYSQDPGTTGWVGVMTRIQSATNGSGYLAFVYNEQVWLYRVDDTGTLNWNALVSANVSAGTAPRDLRLQSQGSTHEVFFNGVLVITYTDPNNVYTSGQPGIAAATFSSILTFNGGTL